jgi:phosphate transport system ATP-binding protein
MTISTSSFPLPALSRASSISTHLTRTASTNGAHNGIKMSLHKLTVHYGAFCALRDVDMVVRDRRITAVIGPSGCGKSTLLRSLNRMNDVVPGCRVEGQLLLDGTNVLANGVDPVAVRQRVGMVFQRPNPFPKSIYENVAYGVRLSSAPSRREMDEIVEHSLRSAALWDEVKDKLHTSGMALSGGQQQRLCIARAIAVQPEVILMDEPCSALDPVATVRIEELMQSLKRDYAIVIVTHNLQQAARSSDYCAMMMMRPDRAGELIEFGETVNLFTNPHDKRTEDYVSGRFG